MEVEDRGREGGRVSCPVMVVAMAAARVRTCHYKQEHGKNKEGKHRQPWRES